MKGREEINNFINLEKMVGKVEEKATTRTFETGSVRDSDTNKPLPSDLHPYVRMRYGYHMRENANKYSKGNWQLGQPNEALLESLHRHLAKFELGIEDGEDHLSGVLFGVKMLMLNERKEGVGMDDFYNLDKRKTP